MRKSKDPNPLRRDRASADWATRAPLVHGVLNKVAKFSLRHQVDVVLLLNPRPDKSAHFPIRFESRRGLARQLFLGDEIPAEEPSHEDEYRAKGAEEAGVGAEEGWLTNDHVLWLQQKPGLRALAAQERGDFTPPDNVSIVASMLKHRELELTPLAREEPRVVAMLRAEDYRSVARGVLEGSIEAGNVDERLYKQRLKEEQEERQREAKAREADLELQRQNEAARKVLPSALRPIPKPVKKPRGAAKRQPAAPDSEDSAEKPPPAEADEAAAKQPRSKKRKAAAEIPQKTKKKPVLKKPAPASKAKPPTKRVHYGDDLSDEPIEDDAVSTESSSDEELFS